MSEEATRYDGSKAAPPYPEGQVICPFCGEPDFDLVGLKMHLFQWCKIFDDIDL